MLLVLPWCAWLAPAPAPAREQVGDASALQQAAGLLVRDREALRSQVDQLKGHLAAQLQVGRVGVGGGGGPAVSSRVVRTYPHALASAFAWVGWGAWAAVVGTAVPGSRSLCGAPSPCPGRAHAHIVGRRACVSPHGMSWPRATAAPHFLMQAVAGVLIAQCSLPSAWPELKLVLLLPLLLLPLLTLSIATVRPLMP